MIIYTNTKHTENKKIKRKYFAHNAAIIKQEEYGPILLENQPMGTLMEKARIKRIRGRSSMNKVELIQALRRN